MPILHLGVIDLPYRDAPKKLRARKPSTMTTGDVAEILEAKYGVMKAFADKYEDKIVEHLTESLEGGLESLLMGSTAGLHPYNAGTDKIEDDFKQFLSSQEIEKLGITGVPTKAALRGVNHRLRHPYRKSNPRRPSFIDTGLYQSSIKAWVD